MPCVMQVVVSSHNKFVDKVLANTTFGVYYGCSLLALRPRGNCSQPLATLSTPVLRSESRSGLPPLPSFVLDSGHGPALPACPASPAGSYVALSTTDLSVVPIATGETRTRSQDDPENVLSSAPPDDCAVKYIEVSARKLRPGDVLLALAPKDFEDKWRHADDFLMITSKTLIIVTCS